MKESKISERAVEFILTCQTEELKNLTGNGIAKVIGINNQILSRSFKADQDMSIPDFVLREKIHRAYFLLSENYRISIDELSRKMGFLKVENFSFEFEKYFAIDPQNFQRCINMSSTILNNSE